MYPTFYEAYLVKEKISCWVALKYFNFYFYAYRYFVCELHGSRICGGQKEALDPLRLELQMVVSYFLSAGNQTLF